MIYYLLWQADLPSLKRHAIIKERKLRTKYKAFCSFGLILKKMRHIEKLETELNVLKQHNNAEDILKLKVFSASVYHT
jgi:hypothetical protein